MHFYAAGIRVARFAAIDPGVARHGLLDHQATRCFRTLFRDETDSAARRIKIDSLKKLQRTPASLKIDSAKPVVF